MRQLRPLVTGALNRRDFLRLSLGGTATALTLAAMPGLALAKPSRPVWQPQPVKATLSDVLNMSATEMAQKSSCVQTNYHYLRQTVATISDTALRRQVLSIVDNPAPTLMALYPTTSKRDAVRQQLVSAGLLAADAPLDGVLPPCSSTSQAPQPFFAAPGSGYASHHSYPGGLVTHTVMNLRVSLGLFQGYHDTFGYQLDRDVIIAAQTLHDLHKPWVFQWREDGSCPPETTVAGTGAHHILGVAESVYRGLPAPVVVAQACAHNHPGTAKDEADVVGYIKAACIIAGKDPVKENLLATDGQTLPMPHRQEGFVTHLGDHDFVFTVPAALSMISILKGIAHRIYGMGTDDLAGKKFNTFRNYVLSQATTEYLYHIYSTQGDGQIISLVQDIVS